MPRYEIVAHVAHESGCGTPEEAAAVFKRRLLDGTEDAVALRHLAVWRLEADPAASPLPAPLRRQLADFFAQLGRCAAEAEDAFRGRVEAILAREASDGAHDGPAHVVSPIVVETSGLDGWETEGGATGRGGK